MDYASMSRAEFEAELRTRAVTDLEFRGKLMADPKTALEGLIGGKLPDGMQVTILHDTADTTNIVIGSDHAVGPDLTADDLDAVAGGGGGDDFWKGFKSGFFTVTACMVNDLRSAR